MFLRIDWKGIPTHPSMLILNLVCKSYKGSKFLYVKLDFLKPTLGFDVKVMDVLIINTSVCMT